MAKGSVRSFARARLAEAVEAAAVAAGDDRSGLHGLQGHGD